jgi:hypothetical protein
MLPYCRDGLRAVTENSPVSGSFHSRLTVTKKSESGAARSTLMRVKLEVAEVPDGLTVYTTSPCRRDDAFSPSGRA